MSITTDPRTVTTGRVRVSPTSLVKRDALLGRTASHVVNPTGHREVTVTGVITAVSGQYPTMVAEGGEFHGCRVRLDSVVTLVAGPSIEESTVAADRLPTEDDITAAVERGKLEIIEDITSLIVPETVTTFSELHEYADANEYGGICDDHSGINWGFQGDLAADPAYRVQDALNAWLQAGRPE